ncbi:27 kDa hemolymph protein-like [Leguminivora glycinivorella]|uniref:27 kDa hemolymph protein-like n=1 Tax=Leguminivora glycinivorella TaxID=1035111 RepID=UPI00200D18F9|nr:27 kDa hemolymph protein-like [Leguminivora glycinivorella]
MLVKLVLAAVMAVGVLGGTIPEEERWLNSLITADFCESGKFQQVLTSMSTFKQCVTEVYSDPNFRAEVRMAKYLDDQPRIVKAFCDKSAQVKTCIRPLVTSMSPCFTASGLRTTQKVFDKALDFFCARDGENTITFIREGGSDCLERKQQDLQTCKDSKKPEITRLIGVYGSGTAIPEKERCKLDKQENDCGIVAVKACGKPNLDKLLKQLIDSVDMNCEE